MDENKNRLFGVMDLKERYREDSQFRAMVDMLEAFMYQNKVQPYEVRDAAFLAELIYRERVFYRGFPLFTPDPIPSCAATTPKEKP